MFTLNLRNTIQHTSRSKGSGKTGLPVSPENTNPVNDGLHLSPGFERRGVYLVNETAPLVTAMWREACAG